jgi:hypothetical protein
MIKYIKLTGKITGLSFNKYNDDGKGYSLIINYYIEYFIMYRNIILTNYLNKNFKFYR